MSHHVNVAVTKMKHAENLDLPAYATEQSAGMDLLAAVTEEQVIAPGERMLVPTGISIALPEGFEAQIRPRSGLAFKNGVTVLNSPGTIDADYRGEVKVLLMNHGNEPFAITRGMRLAQMVVAPYSRVSWQNVETLEETARGVGGFGSTGVFEKKALVA
ncbi:MAG: dUTP diphosphatase [Rickettsiales bacterium]|nr:dUTP diphosphatase [Rickettsiales bacterium]